MGNLLASREVRWFLDHTTVNSAILKDWIERRDPFDEAGRIIPKENLWKGRLGGRPDLYAVIPGADDMGIKWREKELQIKGRRENIGLQSFRGSACGRVEQWLKWSFEGPQVESGFRTWFDVERKAATKIVAITKTRALRKIQVDGRGILTEVPQQSFPDRAVNVELTELQVNGKPFWSLGIEAFPDDSNMAAAFYEVTSRFLEQLRDIRLDAEASHSYPSWLAKMKLEDM